MPPRLHLAHSLSPVEQEEVDEWWRRRKKRRKRRKRSDTAGGMRSKARQSSHVSA